MINLHGKIRSLDYQKRNNSSCGLDSVKSEQIHDHTECRKEMQIEQPDVNKELPTLKIGQDLWRQPKEGTNSSVQWS